MNVLISIVLLQIVFILYLNRKRVKGKHQLTLPKIAFFSTLLFYIILIISTIYLKCKYQHDLDAFDTNSDGLFTGNEISEAQQTAMKNVTSDTGRNFVPFTGIIFSIIYYILLLPILIIFDKINTRFKKNQ